MDIAELLKAAVGGAEPDKVPGVVVASSNARKGEAEFYCEGFADIASGRKMTPDTLFWMASNTKAVAAALVLMFVDDGLLALDDPAEKFIPSWAKIKAAKRPTVRMLLSHQSGLSFFPAFEGEPFKIDVRPVAALAEVAAERPLDHEPCTKYLYSNWGIDTAMAILERISGRKFEDLMAERIFRPLGMNDSYFFLGEKELARLATSYTISADKAPVAQTVDQCIYPYGREGRFAEAGGGLFSTPRDMDRFFRMIAANGVTPSGERLISEASMDEWFTPQAKINDVSTYSFGMEVSADRSCLAHGGAYWTHGRANRVTGDAVSLFVSIVGENAGLDKLRQLRNEKTVIGSGVFKAG